MLINIHYNLKKYIVNHKFKNNNNKTKKKTFINKSLTIQILIYN